MTSPSLDIGSPIPDGARRGRSTIHPDGSQAVDFEVDGVVVGRRFYSDDGALIREYGLRDGKKEGPELTWDGTQLLSAEPYVAGMVHGTVRQFGDDGVELGAYTLDRGTGLDLWRDKRSDGSIFLCEVHRMKDGAPHGLEQWLDEGQRSVFLERSWHEGKRQGIEREWELGLLAQGFPRFFIAGKEVSRDAYLEAALEDAALPAYEAIDDDPERTFEGDVREHLRPPNG